MNDLTMEELLSNKLSDANAKIDKLETKLKSAYKAISILENKILEQQQENKRQIDIEYKLDAGGNLTFISDEGEMDYNLQVYLHNMGFHVIDIEKITLTISEYYYDNYMSNKPNKLADK